MNRDLFLAILAMDSYHCGYGVSIKDLPESGQIGNATIGKTSADLEDVPEGWRRGLVRADMQVRARATCCRAARAMTYLPAASAAISISSSAATDRMSSPNAAGSRSGRVLCLKIGGTGW